MATQERRYSKAELVREIDAAWSALTAVVERLTAAQMTEVRDAQGWTVTDHLVHLAAWERSVVVFLQGRPRHEGLGVDAQLYRAGDEDAINAAIQEQGKELSPAKAWASLREVHGQLVGLLAPLRDDDLYTANSDYQAEDPGERDERPLIGLIYGNTAHHFREHQTWIEQLVAQGS